MLERSHICNVFLESLLLGGLLMVHVGCSQPPPARFAACAQPVASNAARVAPQTPGFLTLVGVRFGTRSSNFAAKPIIQSEATFQASLINLTTTRAALTSPSLRRFMESVELRASDGQSYRLVPNTREFIGLGVTAEPLLLESGDSYLIENARTWSYSWCLDRGSASMRYQYPPVGPAVFFADVPSTGPNFGRDAPVQRVRYELDIP